VDEDHQFEVRKKSVNILGIDIGTKTGYCYNRGEQLTLGTWELATDKEITRWGKTRQRRTEDPRIDRLCKRVDALGHFDVVIFEDVEFASSTYQVQLWSSLRASVWLCSSKTAIQCIPVGTLKLFATGDGHAGKEKMHKFFQREKLHGMHLETVLTDDSIDAYFLHKWAKQNISLSICKNSNG